MMMMKELKKVSEGLSEIQGESENNLRAIT